MASRVNIGPPALEPIAEVSYLRSRRQVPLTRAPVVTRTVLNRMNAVFRKAIPNFETLKFFISVSRASRQDKELGTNRCCSELMLRLELSVLGVGTCREPLH